MVNSPPTVCSLLACRAGAGETFPPFILCVLWADGLCRLLPVLTARHRTVQQHLWQHAFLWTMMLYNCDAELCLCACLKP